MPRNWKGDGRASEDTKVVPIVRILPEIIGIHNQELSKSLLQACVELVTETRLDRREYPGIYAVEYGVYRWVLGPKAGQNQILVVVGRLDARVSDPKNLV